MLCFAFKGFRGLGVGMSLSFSSCVALCPTIKGSRIEVRRGLDLIGLRHVVAPIELVSGTITALSTTRWGLVICGAGWIERACCVV